DERRQPGSEAGVAPVLVAPHEEHEDRDRVGEAQSPYGVRDEEERKDHGEGRQENQKEHGQRGEKVAAIQPGMTRWLGQRRQALAEGLELLLRRDLRDDGGQRVRDGPARSSRVPLGF